MKNKDKLFEGLEQSSSEAKKMRRCDYEQVDKAVFKWFSLQRSQNVPIDGPRGGSKATATSKMMPSGANTQRGQYSGANTQRKGATFKASDGWLDKWEKR